MIKAVLIALGLVLGAVIAVAQAGRIGQLASIPGVEPPPWAAYLTPDSGLTRGRASVDQGIEMSWQLAPLTLTPPRWNAKARAPAGEASFAAVPGWTGAEITLQGGTLDLAALGPPALTGDVLLTGGQAALPWATRRLSSLNVQGRVVNLVFQGEGLGAFDLTLDAQMPVWRATLASVPGNPVSATVLFEGLSGAAALQLTLRVEDTPDLPDGIRAILQRTASASSTGWDMRQRLPLPRPLP